MPTGILTPMPTPDEAPPSPHATAGTSPTPLDAWFEGPLGRFLLNAESREVAAGLEDVFGNQFLQIGHWGPRTTFLPYARTPRRALIAEPQAPGDLISHASQLPILIQQNHPVLCQQIAAKLRIGYPLIMGLHQR